MRAPQLAARRTEEFLATFWVHGKSFESVPGKMVKVPALEALFMMVKVGRSPEILPWDYTSTSSPDWKMTVTIEGIWA